MENKNIDTELRSLVQNHKQDIKDNGFSKNVLQNIPHKQKSNEWLVIPFAIIGGIVTFILLNPERLLKIAIAAENHPERVFFTIPIVLLIVVIVFIILEREKSIRLFV